MNKPKSLFSFISVIFILCLIIELVYLYNGGFDYIGLILYIYLFGGIVNHTLKYSKNKHKQIIILWQMVCGGVYCYAGYLEKRNYILFLIITLILLLFNMYTYFKVGKAESLLPAYGTEKYKMSENLHLVVWPGSIPLFFNPKILVSGEGAFFLFFYISIFMIELIMTKKNREKINCILQQLILSIILFIYQWNYGISIISTVIVEIGIIIWFLCAAYIHWEKESKLS